MNDWKFALSLATCCCMALTVAPSASADFVGVTTAIKDDPDTAFLCTQGNGPNIPGPLTVCNVSAAFDDPNNVLLSVGSADLQVFNGADPDVFFQHPLNFTPVSPPCGFIPIFPDLICDSFVTIGHKCGPGPPSSPDGTSLDGDFDASEFNLYGHIVGGWFNSDPSNDQGTAGYFPDLQVLFLQSSVSQGLSMSGDINLFWRETYNAGETFAELDVPIECGPGCPDGYRCDDGDPCTQDDVCNNQVCEGTPLDCNDGNHCTDDYCDPASGCVNMPNNDPCDDGDACTENDQCGDDGCVHGTPVDCDDGNPCTEDACDPASGCTFGPVDCDDGDKCTDDSCNPEGGCTNTPTDCSDGNQCTEDGCDPKDGCVYTKYSCDDDNECTDDSCNPEDGCTNTPIDCSDGDLCTNDLCDPDMGCTHEEVECPKGQVCDPASGKCVEDQDPCECIDGKVTICHIPPGNPDNTRTIRIGCPALDHHLAHGDTCGPCE